MKAIARPVGTGKTKELMELAAANNGMIFTINKRALQVKANSYGFSNLTFIDWDDLFSGDFDHSRPLYIHKLDDVMEEFLRHDYGLSLQGFSVAMEA